MPGWFLLPLLLGLLLTAWGLILPRMQWRWLGYWGAPPEEDRNPASFYRNLRFVNLAGLIALGLCTIFFFGTVRW
ncbi:hypothetical protein [Protaetiibacter larvae]|uniref:Uncharacterized protein n=1 Tax=Protaetiibacter larvae TaxID=2592654 RepID=A0A5C1Y6Z6_9MICO|nr:hypothetical protein [Protaetiibacter larvae]QEO09576.1 hypothetical protein FLP23_05880 [Protaetiibacter larvae]